MEFETWEPFYRQILNDFGFSQQRDEVVAAELDRLLGGTRFMDSELRSLLRGKEVTVAGNGPNAAAEIHGSRGTLITADEATSVACHRIDLRRHVAIMEGEERKIEYTQKFKRRICLFTGSLHSVSPIHPRPLNCRNSKWIASIHSQTVPVGDCKTQVLP